MSRGFQPPPGAATSVACVKGEFQPREQYLAARCPIRPANGGARWCRWERMPSSVSRSDETDLGSGSRQADDDVKYEFKSVQALRGRDSSAKAKWQWPTPRWFYISKGATCPASATA